MMLIIYLPQIAPGHPGKKNRVIYPADAVFEIGKGYTAKEGTDISIIACGEMVDYALQVADQAEEAGISVRVIDMFTVKPLDEEIVLKAAEETGRIIVWEDHLMKNGLASAVADTLAETRLSGTSKDATI